MEKWVPLDVYKRQIQGRLGAAGQLQRGAEAARDEKAAVGADRAGKAQHRGRFARGVGQRLLLRGLALALRGLGAFAQERCV